MKRQRTKQLGDVRWEQAKAIYRRLAVAREGRNLQAVAEELNALGRMFEAHMGRPCLDFDQKTFEQLCGLQCSLGEIAQFMGMSEDTVESRCHLAYGKTFSEVFAQKRQNGLVSLRRTQFAMATTVPAMAIFLGKNYLNQSDRLSVDVSKLDSDIERELAVLTAGSQAGIVGEVESETIN